MTATMIASSTLPDYLTRTPLDPFGLLIQTSAGNDLRTLAPTALARLTGSARVLVMRGFAAMSTEEWTDYCRSWGPLLRWPFGEVLDLVVHDDPKNYLFTPGPVPFHWDGAFAEQVPSYMFFQCRQAPPIGNGGETTFCDTSRVLADLDDARRKLWSGVRVRYRTEKIEHYGGDVESHLVCRHPLTGVANLRFAEPLDPARYKNPLFLEIDGVAEDEQREFLEDLRKRLYSPSACYVHSWQDGDYVIVDNHAVLHGRLAFTSNSPRWIQRVHIV